jgi:hypothetical protein
MFNLKRGTVAAVAVSFGLFTMLGTAVAGVATEANNDIAQMLRAGGFVIVFRHGATFPNQADTDPLNFDDIAAQRNLNDKGKVLAKAFGDAVRRVGIPVGKVYTSKYNRAYETAVIAGFKDIEKTADLTEGGLVVSPNENNRRIEAFHKMLGTVPQPGTNTILITHTEDRRWARQGLVRRERRRGLALPPGERQLQACRPGADGRMALHRRGEVGQTISIRAD